MINWNDSIETISFEPTQASVFMAVTIIPTLLAFLSTSVKFLVLGNHPDNMTGNFALNGMVLLLVIVFIVVLNTARKVEAFDLIIITYMWLLGIVLAVNQFYRQPDFVGSLFLLYILNNMLFMPLPIRKQVRPTITFSVVIIVLYGFFKNTTYPSESINTIISIITLNVVGYTFSRSIGRYRRMNFLHIRRARETRSKLEESMEKVKRLSGILPICSHSTKVRDIDGAWIRTETYIQKYSDAELSHGVCPECAEHHFGSD